MRAALNGAGISYHWKGDNLGGLSATGDVLDYEQAVKRPAFQQALAQCTEMSEAEPCDCHRFLLIARHLDEEIFPVRHLRRDGSVETTRETEDRLLVLTRQTDADLLASREQRVGMAYRAQALRLARKAR